MTALPTVCVLAGGKGARLGERVRDVPKPLVEVAGEPFLIHQLRLLAAHGASHVVLCVGYLGAQIEARIGDEHCGIRIEYSYDEAGLSGTLGAIRRAEPLLPERFLVLYGDTYLRLDYRDAAEAWQRSGRLGLMTVLKNDGRWDKSNVLYRDGLVVAYNKARRTPQMQWIDYGLGGLRKGALAAVDAAETDLAVLYSRLAQSRELFGYEVHERFYEIGSPVALAETDEFLGQLISRHR